MREALIISFDFMRKGDAFPPLAIASLLAHAKADIRYENEFRIEHISFDMLNDHDKPCSYFMAKVFENCMRFDTILISVYIWSDYLVVKLIEGLRKIGYQGKIVLGGYQISYGQKEMLKYKYPECDIFISGYGENSLIESIFMERPKNSIYLNKELDFDELASPYLSAQIDVIPGQHAVRLETKRGCPYRCSFCAHRDLAKNKIYNIKRTRVIAEIKWLYSRQVRKINILDPVFNIGGEYLYILEEMVRMKLSSIISLQCRFERIRGEKGNHFISLVEKMDVVLEFGLQTIFEEECKVINRTIDLGHVEKILKLLKKKDITYEISLIYGLPNQTVDSFRRSIDFVLENGAKKVFAFPLLLLRGTALYEQKQKWNLTEKILGDFHIPTVISGNTFDEDDWLRMHEIAGSLSGG